MVTQKLLDLGLIQDKSEVRKKRRKATGEYFFRYLLGRPTGKYGQVINYKGRRPTRAGDAQNRKQKQQKVNFIEKNGRGAFIIFTF